MEIEDLSQNLAYTSLQAGFGAKKTKDAAPPKKSFSVTFKEKLLDAGSIEEHDERRAALGREEFLTLLLDDVHEAGEKLAAHPTIDDIKRYKDAVQKFMKFVVSESADVSVEQGVPASQKPGFKGIRGSEEARERKPFSIVKIVDEKLETLAQSIMSAQVKQIDVLARLEEINGLLVDMLR